jgi:hypothetical protein
MYTSFAHGLVVTHPFMGNSVAVLNGARAPLGTHPHAPPLHDTPPHELPHLLQLFWSVSRLASHPLLLALPSQLPQFALQLIWQAPRLHDALPLAPLHDAPQAPQFDTLVCVFVSHPLAGMPSQSAKPALQLCTLHVPVLQVAVAFGREHTLPHAPQFVVVVSGASQPFFGSPSQLPQPDVQVGTHRPFWHCVDPWPFEQTVPQAPQLFTSVSRVVSQPLGPLPSQLPQPAVHDGTQAPLVQAVLPCALAQAVPQAPQFVVVVSGASHPSAVVALQLPYPELHVEIAQLPAEQVAVAFWSEHGTPQAPQFDVLVSAVSQPLLAFASQLPHPETQVGTHAPLVHAVVPCAFVQGLVQEPQ